MRINRPARRTTQQRRGFVAVPVLLLAMLAPLLAVAPAASAQGEGSVIISEIFYNAPGQAEGHEFVELHNPGSTTVNLSGWRFQAGITLTFPNGTSLAPNARLTVAANAADFQSQFGFAPSLTFTGALSNGGETIILSTAGGSVVDRVAWSDVLPWPSSADGGGDSLVRINNAVPADAATDWVAGSPTPQAPNSPNASVLFSIGRGWYGGSRTVTLTPTVPGATIRYNTNGSGSVTQTYTGPITVAANQDVRVIQAAAVIGGQVGTIVTHSYVFKADTGVPVVVMWPNGRAVAPGESEATRSFEFIPPPSTGLAAVGADAGVKASAGGVDAGDSDKVFFRGAYDAGTLRADLFSDRHYGIEPVPQIDQLFLRNEHLDGTHLRQIVAQDALLAAGQLSPHGRFVEYYRDGSDRGIRHLQERPEGGFMEAYTGIDKSQWRSWSTHEVSPGGGVSNGLGAATMGAPFSSWSQVTNAIDVEALIDYQLVQWQAKVSDYRNIKNFRISGPTNAANGDGADYRFRFFNWDMDLGYNNDRYGRGGPTGWGWAGYVSPDYLLHELDGFVQLGLLASDRIACAHFDGGPLTASAFGPRLQARRAELAAAGGVNESSFVSSLQTWIGQRNNWLLDEYRSGGADRTVYGSFRPDADPWKPPSSFVGPLLGDRDPVNVSVVDGVLTIGNRAGFPVWYRLDGGDPRTASGARAAEAIQYTGPVTLPAGRHDIIARSFDSSRSRAVDRWSPACNEAESFDAPVPPGPYEPGLILNEWNAVGSANTLAGGDSYFGSIIGNGGDWFELVVVEDHLDVRGWKLELSDAELGAPAVTDTFTFSNSAALSDLRAGTIITIAEDVGDDVSFSPAAGDWWINLQADSSDSGAYFTASTQSNFDTNNDDWQLRILDETGAVRFGPAGEGVGGLTGVSSTEIGELETDPSASIEASSGYGDGNSSTFGAPNGFDAGFQDFTALRSWFGGVDTTPPSSAVTSPADGADVGDGAVVLAGASTDDVGVTRVRVAVQDIDSKLWLQTDGSFAAGWASSDASLVSPGAVATDWSFAMTLPDGRYRTSVKAFDAANNSESSVRSRFDVVTVGEDVTAPVTVVSSPADDAEVSGPAVSLTGTSTDDVGVDRVRIALLNLDLGLWLQADGSFGTVRYFGEASLASPDAPVTDWTYAVSLPDARFRAIVKADDAVNNVEAAVRSQFEVVAGAADVEAPSSSITSSSDQVVGAVTFEGQATDNVGVSGVKVWVRNRDNQLWVQADGSLGLDRHAFDAVVTNAGGASTGWSIDTNLPGAGRYRVLSQATDTSNNKQTPATGLNLIVTG